MKQEDNLEDGGKKNSYSAFLLIKRELKHVICGKRTPCHSTDMENGKKIRVKYETDENEQSTRINACG